MQEGEALVALSNPSERSTIVWHKKLGHMYKQGMKILMEENLFPSLTNVSLPFCEHCVTRHKLKFNTSNYKRKEILELVHIDVW